MTAVERVEKRAAQLDDRWDVLMVGKWAVLMAADWVVQTADGKVVTWAHVRVCQLVSRQVGELGLRLAAG